MREIPTDPRRLEQVADRRPGPGPFDPDVLAFFGCAPLDREAESPAAGQPCLNCGAVYDERGRLIEVIPTPPDVAEATGIVGVRTGVHAGDDGLVCGRCLCLSPANRARVRAGTRPRPRRESRADRLAARVRPRLTKSERAGLEKDAAKAIRPVVRAFLAREAAVESGDDATADALSALLATADTADRKAFAAEFRRIKKGAARGSKAVDRRDDGHGEGVAQRGGEGGRGDPGACPEGRLG